MVIRVVVLLADQYPRLRGKPLDQLFRRQPFAGAKVTNNAQVRTIAAFGALPGRYRRQALAGGQQAADEKQENAHEGSLFDSASDDQRMTALRMALHQHLQAKNGPEGFSLEHLLR